MKPINQEDLEDTTYRFKQFLTEHNAWKKGSPKVYALFLKEFNGRDKRTFQRWRKNLLSGTRLFEDTNNYRKVINDNECYFCETKDKDRLVVHHVDRNRSNNSIENLRVVCTKCHSRFHQLLEATEKTTDKKTIRQV